MDRYGRMISRVKRCWQAGLLVVTSPPEVREALRWPAELERWHNVVIGVLKEHGIREWESIWHFKGDKSPDYAPHLNVVIPDWGYMPPGLLEEIKKAIRARLGVREDADIHYSYRVGPRELCHLARYLTRPTWGGGPEWETELAVRLYRRRWHRVSNGWKKREGVWDVEKLGARDRQLVKLVECECPFCGGPIDWQEVMPVWVGCREVVAGYWYAAPVRAGPREEV